MGGVRWRSDDADWVFLASRPSYTLLSLTASGAEAVERNPQEVRLHPLMKFYSKHNVLVSNNIRCNDSFAHTCIYTLLSLTSGQDDVSVGQVSRVSGRLSERGGVPPPSAVVRSVGAAGFGA